MKQDMTGSAKHGVTHTNGKQGKEQVAETNTNNLLKLVRNNILEPACFAPCQIWTSHVCGVIKSCWR